MSDQQPLVSVICLCYNQSDFVDVAVRSVYAQTYTNFELIIVDDASEDDSQNKISQYVNHASTQIILLETNVGNCKAFNKACQKCKGKYIIDLAADDKLNYDRIEKQVEFFENKSENTGVVFSNSVYIDKDGKFLKYHYPIDKTGRSVRKIFQGDVFAQLVSTYFISSPTMMIRKTVLDELNGYDENLAYEDFDFWVRSSRKYHYAYQDEVLTEVRKLPTSYSEKLYKRGDLQLHSTFLVCKKVINLVENDTEKEALVKRIKFEIRQSVFSGNFDEASCFFEILKEVGQVNGIYLVIEYINRKKIRLSFLRDLYLKIRYSW